MPYFSTLFQPFEIAHALKYRTKMSHMCNTNSEIHNEFKYTVICVNNKPEIKNFHLYIFEYLDFIDR